MKSYPFRVMIRMFELEMLLVERMGKDCASVVMRFVTPSVAPYDPYLSLVTCNPWGFSTEVDPCAGIALPLFSP